LRSILEADQEEDNEESGDITDKEINGIIARSDRESESFWEMGVQRIRNDKNEWALSYSYSCCHPETLLHYFRISLLHAAVAAVTATSDLAFSLYFSVRFLLHVECTLLLLPCALLQLVQIALPWECCAVLLV